MNITHIIASIRNKIGNSTRLGFLTAAVVLVAAVTQTVFPLGQVFAIPVSGPVTSPVTTVIQPPNIFTDGRCNQSAEQAATVYPDGKGGFYFYAVNSGVGYWAIHVTKAQLGAYPDKGVTYLIAQEKGVQLYRLAGGHLEIRRIKPDGTVYIFDFDPTNCTA